ncbi:RNA polymerase I-specific transcription initiation factor-domain-containing protein [Xylariomycetidae sp. FL0641]|nr:RNA polymerase I-specific transcription initiation factor-domain-containing protein [Xylariomycetidae sp. FL0641]
MASSANESDEYVPSSDGSELDDDRPNRWTGHPATWQQLNRAEIDTLTALDEIRSRDLAVHLYNAYALKHRHEGTQESATTPVAGQDINRATGLPVSDSSWVPPKTWTAWPVRADKVPPAEFMGHKPGVAEDDDTCRQQSGREPPSAALEECICAAVLKAAKERFNARPWAVDEKGDGELTDGVSDEEEDEDDDDQSTSTRSRSRSRSRSKSRSVKHESGVSSSDEDDVNNHPDKDADRMDVDQPDRAPAAAYAPPKQRPLRPAPAADDAVSYALLRPGARHVIARLERVLLALHRAREAAVNYQSDSDTSDESSRSRSRSRSRRPRSGSRGTTTTTTTGRPRGRPRKASRAPSQVRTEDEAEAEAEAEEEGAPKRRRGRPRKTYPRREGETDEEYTVRVAKLQKKAVPVFGAAAAASSPVPVPVPASSPPASSAAAAAAGSETEGTSRGRLARTRTRAQRKRRREDEPPDLGAARHRTAPRAWRDVLGAAALAGWPPAALDRAARRCATVFAAEVVLATLDEGPGPGPGPGTRARRYAPGMPVFPDDAGEEDEGREGRMMGRSRSRSRSRSGSAGPARFCGFADCPRARDGFARRANLVRHLRLVHGVAEAEAAAAEFGDVDSEDEMLGAVHVDGFLKTIQVRPGWRAGDVGEAARVRRKRVRGEEEDGEGVADWGGR